jgi:hypothetical protein
MNIADKAVYWLLGLCTVLSILVILISAATVLRDELWKQGWIRKGWLAEGARRSSYAAVKAVLDQIGFRDDHFDIVRKALDQHKLSARLKRISNESSPLSIRVLQEIKPVTFRLEIGFSYQESGDYYIDTMGAMFNSDPGCEPFANLLTLWIGRLIKEGVISQFDCVLANKDGNLTLANKVFSYFSSSGNLGFFACKGPRDSSRVKRTDNQAPHITDFEGLRFYLDEKGNSVGRRLRVLAIDDNCTAGTTLCTAIKQFNILTENMRLPFEPISDAVVLFTVKDARTAETFRDHSIRLHAIVSLGKAEMQKLIELDFKEITERLAEFKQGFGCETSLIREI